jgi:hypothetical protein
MILFTDLVHSFGSQWDGSVEHLAAVREQIVMGEPTLSSIQALQLRLNP